jgi:hypothetical protein
MTYENHKKPVDVSRLCKPREVRGVGGRLSTAFILTELLESAKRVVTP